MPYENEESSAIASSKFNNTILNESHFHSNFQFNDKNKNTLLLGLSYLWENKKIYRNLEVQKNKIYDNLQCIDGSLVSNYDNYGGEYINMQFGSAFLEIEKLFQIERDNKGNVNPYHVAKIYNNDHNILLSTQFPGKNIYFNKNGQILTLKQSFLETINHLFSTSNPIVDSFLDDLDKIGQSPKNNKFSEIVNIKTILNDIRDESIIYSTQKEVQKIMLISEVMMSQYLLKKVGKTKDLIILDGRLHNQDIGGYIKEINPSLINDQSMLVGVQKTGILNIILTEIHNILKKTTKNKDLNILFDMYKNGQGIFFILDNEFKTICGIPQYKVGNYGQECFYITQAPKRQEFVFTLPEHLFKDPGTTLERQKIANLSKDTILKMAGIFEYAHTDLYLGNKGVLLANVLAHSNVSLNKNLTNIIPNSFTNNINQNKNLVNKLKI